MDNLVLLSYIIAMIFGFLALGIIGSITLRVGDQKLIAYLLFYGAMTLDALLETVYRYFLVNQPEILELYSLHWMIVFDFFRFTVMFAVILLTRYFSSSKPMVKMITPWALFSMGCFGVSVFISIRGLSLSFLPFSISEAVFYGISMVVIGISFMSFKLGIPQDRPKLKKIEHLFLKRIILLYIGAFPFIVNDDFSLVSLPFRISPVVFLILSIIVLQHFYKHYLSAYFASSRKKDCLREFQKHGISQREGQTVLLALQGLSNRQISEELNVSLSTVKSHLYSVFKKMGIQNRFELIHAFRKFQ